jgi:hypothetical protein
VSLGLQAAGCCEGYRVKMSVSEGRRLEQGGVSHVVGIYCVIFNRMGLCKMAGRGKLLRRPDSRKRSEQDVWRPEISNAVVT